MERARKILKWNQRSETVKTGFVILIVIGATLGTYGIFSVAMGTSTPLVVVESKSMTPTLDVGYLLVLQKRAPDKIYLNDIVVYNATFNPKPIVHRVVEIQIVNGTYQYYTKGDNNTVRDPGYRLYRDIIGVVVTAIPYVGYVTLFLHTSYGLPIVFVIFLALIIIPEFFFKDEKEDENKKEELKDEASNT